MGKILNAVTQADGDVAAFIRRALEKGGNGSSCPPPVQEPSEGGSQRPVAVEPEPRVHVLPWNPPESGPLLAVKAGERAAEEYRSIRTRILQHPTAPSVIVVSSPGSGDGKTVTAINLAATFAIRSEQDVLLIDTDLRRPAVHSRLGAWQSPGVSEILGGTCSFEEAVLRIGQFPKLHVLPSGESTSHASELLDSSAWRALSSLMRAQFRTVILDCPPVGAVTDFDLIAAASDAVLLVVTPDVTDRGLCFQALDRVRQRLIGVLINKAEDWILWNHYAHESYLTGSQHRNEVSR